MDRREFAALTKLFDELNDRFVHEVAAEEDLNVGLATFSTADPALGPLLDAWIAASPRSAAPRLARAKHLLDIAQTRRGTKLASQTTREQLRDIDAFLARAVEDARAALDLDARAAFAYGVLMDAARLHGDVRGCGEASRAALAIVPASYQLRRTAMVCLTPRWGGSYEMMDEFARRAQQWRDQNPRLETLGGFSAWERGHAFIDQQRPDDAIRALNRALEFGDEVWFYDSRGDALSGANRYREALADYDRALALAPLDVDAVAAKGTILQFIHQSDERFARDLAAIERIDPTSDALERYRTYPARLLVYEGYRLSKVGRLDDAIARFTRAHEISPGKTEALSERSAVYVEKHDFARALQDLEEDIRLDPHRFISYKRIDAILSKDAQWERIAGYWNGYVAVEPDDPRGYMERGAAYSHTPDKQKAVFDAEKACQLGDADACKLARSLGG